jgi:hypothetical protein
MPSIPPPSINRPAVLEEVEYMEMTDEDLIQCIQETMATRTHLAVYLKACETRLTRIVNASIQKKTQETERHKRIAKAAYKALKKQKEASEVSRPNLYLAYN